MSVKRDLKPFRAYLHYGDASHPPMHTASFLGNRYDLNVLIRQAEAEGEPLRVQEEGGGKRRVAKRKRSYSGRSKTTRTGVKRGHAKRRTVTRLRRRVATKPRGYGVMRHAVPNSYRGIHGYSVQGMYRNDATGLKARLVEIRPQGASPARYVIEWIDGPRKGEEQEVSERRMAGTFTGPI
jgi:hypothetical protein